MAQTTVSSWTVSLQRHSYLPTTVCNCQAKLLNPNPNYIDIASPLLATFGGGGAHNMAMAHHKNAHSRAMAHHNHNRARMRMGRSMGPGYGRSRMRRDRFNDSDDDLGQGYSIYGPRPLTRGEQELSCRACMCFSTFGIAELFRCCFCPKFGKYPPPDVDPVTGIPIDPETGRHLIGQPMEQPTMEQPTMVQPTMVQPVGEPMAQPVGEPTVQPTAPSVSLEYNGTVYEASYASTPQSMVADSGQGNYGYSSSNYER